MCIRDRCVIAGALALVAGSITAPLLSAQSRQAPADTGRMAWGHKDYTRYTSVDQCDRAAMHVWADVGRVYVPDTGQYSAKADTVPSAVIAAARACGTKFTAADTDPRELWSLMRLSLILGNDAQAKAVVERQYALAKTSSERATVLTTAIATYMGFAPPRLSAAQALLARLDSLGPTEKVAQFNARLDIMKYWHTLYDVDSLRAHANAALDRIQAMTQDERDAVPVYEPYMELLMIANEQQDLETQQKLLDRALADVGTWREGRGAEWTGPSSSLLETRRAIYGKKARPLAGSFWFNNGGVPKPAPGKLSLLVHVSHVCSVQCFPLYTLIRQLNRQYGSELDITFVTDTRGFAPGTGPIPANEEAQHASKYFHEFLKLPVGLLVDETPFTKRPDGRLVHKTSPIGELFNGWRMVNAVLIDAGGRIRWLGALSSGSDKRMIESAINKAKNAQVASE